MAYLACKACYLKPRNRKDGLYSGGKLSQRKTTLSGSLPALINFAGYSANQKPPSSNFSHHTPTAFASAISQKARTHITETNYFTFSPILLALSRGGNSTIPKDGVSRLYEKPSATSPAQL